MALKPMIMLMVMLPDDDEQPIIAMEVAINVEIMSPEIVPNTKMFLFIIFVF